LKGEGGKKVAQSGDGECFLFSVSDGIEEEGLALVLVLNVDTEISGDERCDK
jgi:hypothetical protein